MLVDVYQCKNPRFPGTSYGELNKKAQEVFKLIKNKTKRKPYIKSKWFKGEKIFFDYFWIHIQQKRMRVRVERLKLFLAAIEVLENSRIKPTIKIDPNNKSVRLYRFAGRSKDGVIFYVQVKEDLKRRQKFLMSCFPEKNKNKILRRGGVYKLQAEDL